MVKYLLSFLISFKSFPENDIQEVPFSKSKKDVMEDQPFFRFKAHPDRKNICNITYILPGPKEFIEKKISIACWSPMVKVFSKKEDLLFRTETIDDKTWAAFTIKQKGDNISQEQLRMIYGKYLEFYFNEDPRYNQRFRLEQWATYMAPNLPQRKPFELVFQIKDKAKPVAAVKSTIAIIDSKKKRSSGSKHKIETASKSKIIFSEPEVCEAIPAQHLYKIMKSMKKPLREEDTVTSRTPTNCSLFLPISYLFHDKSVWVLRNDRTPSKNIQDIFVFITVCSFLGNEAKKALNPLSINVKSLQYLPTKELQAEGINKIFVEYELPPIIPTTRTKLQYLKEDGLIHLKEYKVILTDEFSRLTLISSIQSKKLLVRVIGIKDNITQKKSEQKVISDDSGIYGESMKDDRFSNCMKMPPTYELEPVKTPAKPKSTTQRSRMSILKTGKMKNRKRDEQLNFFLNKDSQVLIGTARIDLSPLVFGNNSVITYEEVSSLPVLIDDPRTPDFEHICITTIHEDFCKYENGLIKNRFLYQNNVMIKLTAKTCSLLTPHCVKLDPSIENAYSRVICVLWDKDFATEILKKLFMFNREALDLDDFNFPLVPFRKMYTVKKSPPIKSILITQTETDTSDVPKVLTTTFKNIVTECYFTGFCIDCLNEVIMYVEAPTINSFPKLLTELLKFNVSQGRIHYSSDLIFDKRIYKSFKENGGIYGIATKSTVDDLIKKSASFCYGVSVPTPAWKALKMLSKLSTCKNLLEITQDNYLPRPEQLLSFDIEFGIPHCIVK